MFCEFLSGLTNLLGNVLEHATISKWGQITGITCRWMFVVQCSTVLAMPISRTVHADLNFDWYYD